MKSEDAAAQKHFLKLLDGFDWSQVTRATWGPMLKKAVAASSRQLSPEDKSDHKDWCCRQARYRRAIKAGLGAVDSEIYAVFPGHVTIETYSRIAREVESLLRHKEHHDN